MLPGAAPSAQAVPPTPAELGLAAYCRRLFGLEFYGLDCIPAAGGPVVIEVNDNPSIESGYEDTVLKDVLYEAVMGSFYERLERGRRQAGKT